MRASLLITFIASAIVASAAEPRGTTFATLNALVSQAVTANPELAFYEAEIAAAKGERKASGTRRNPEVTTEIGRKRVRGDINAEGTAWSVSVQQEFEWPGRIALRKAIADQQIQLAEAGLDQFRAALAAEMRKRGFALFSAQRRAQAALEVSARGEELVSTLVQRELAGVAPLLERRAVEAAVIKLRREATEASTEAQTALFELNQLRGAPIEAPVTISEAGVQLGDIPAVDQLLRRAGRGNFTLMQRGIELAQQGFKVRLAENEAWPSITAGPSFSRESAGERETVAGLSVSVPLPLWNRNAGNIDTARARELQAQTALRVAQREVEMKLRARAADYEMHRKEMARWSPGVADELREAATLADRHYRLGAVPLTTYLEVQSSYLEALQAIYATQADAMNALAEIELLTGSKLLKP